MDDAIDDGHDRHQPLIKNSHCSTASFGYLGFIWISARPETSYQWNDNIIGRALCECVPCATNRIYNKFQPKWFIIWRRKSSFSCSRLFTFILAVSDARRCPSETVPTSILDWCLKHHPLWTAKPFSRAVSLEIFSLSVVCRPDGHSFPLPHLTAYNNGRGCRTRLEIGQHCFALG